MSYVRSQMSDYILLCSQNFNPLRDVSLCNYFVLF